MLKTYSGSCHCGAVTFEADIDLDAGTSKCNCSICTKRRAWKALVKPDAFRLLSGADALRDYSSSPAAHHRFCSTCGCAPFGDGHLDVLGGDYVGVAVTCLDIPAEEMAAAPVRICNGRDNLWWEEPTVTAHL